MDAQAGYTPYGDSHMNSMIRFKLALTEDTPTIRPYYEERWAELNDSRELDIEFSLQILDALHRRWVALLHTLSDEDYAKQFYHPGSQETTRLDYNLGFTPGMADTMLPISLR